MVNEGRVESSTEEKYKNLREIFRAMGKVLVAFSGGTDSTFLLRVAVDTLGAGNVLAVTATSPLYPEREMANAKRMV